MTTVWTRGNVRIDKTTETGPEGYYSVLVDDMEMTRHTFGFRSVLAWQGAREIAEQLSTAQT